MESSWLVVLKVFSKERCTMGESGIHASCTDTCHGSQVSSCTCSVTVNSVFTETRSSFLFLLHHHHSHAVGGPLKQMFFLQLAQSSTIFSVNYSSLIKAPIMSNQLIHGIPVFFFMVVAYPPFCFQDILQHIPSLDMSKPEQSWFFNLQLYCPTFAFP